MKKTKWLTEGILFIRDGDDYTCVPYKGFIEKYKLINNYRDFDYVLYKDEGSGLSYDFLIFLLNLLIIVFLVCMFN